MKLPERMRSPTALALQGFVAGAFLFFTVHPLAPGQQEVTPPSGTIELTIPA